MGEHGGVGHCDCCINAALQIGELRGKYEGDACNTGTWMTLRSLVGMWDCELTEMTGRTALGLLLELTREGRLVVRPPSDPDVR